LQGGTGVPARDHAQDARATFKRHHYINAYLLSKFTDGREAAEVVKVAVLFYLDVCGGEFQFADVPGIEVVDWFRVRVSSCSAFANERTRTDPRNYTKWARNVSSGFVDRLSSFFT